jgi:tubulin polyglutamylase TTLL6/13
MQESPELILDLSACRYSAVKSAAIESGWTIKDEKKKDFHLYWCDRNANSTRVHNLKPHQMINHFAGMVEICSKSRLAHNIIMMQGVVPSDYDFFPKTWIIPENYDSLLLERKCPKREKGRMYIVKPENSSQGRGIFLTETEKDENIREAMWKLDHILVAQRYIQNPFLISGLKFDIRLYVLITSCDPLRVYLFHDGLARFCTEAYQPANAGNKNNQFMHLTNFCINRTHATNYEPSPDASKGTIGSKRTLSAVLDVLKRDGHPVDALWPCLHDMAAKVAIAAQPALARRHHACLPGDVTGDRCFELLGMDVLLDADFRPWLLEMNLTPSLLVRSSSHAPQG